jgi:hypothetical protein
MYYRDPCAEDKGIMDGVIDLNTVTAVTPLQVARNYGFQTVVSSTVSRSIVSCASEECLFLSERAVALRN